MKPTPRLRFIERFVEAYKHDSGVSSGHSIRILQQWWEDGSFSHVNTFNADGEHVRPGEWRDVPLEKP